MNCLICFKACLLCHNSVSYVCVYVYSGHLVCMGRRVGVGVLFVIAFWIVLSLYFFALVVKKSALLLSQFLRLFKVKFVLQRGHTFLQRISGIWIKFKLFSLYIYWQSYYWFENQKFFLFFLSFRSVYMLTDFGTARRGGA